MRSGALNDANPVIAKSNSLGPGRQWHVAFDAVSRWGFRANCRSLRLMTALALLDVLRAIMRSGVVWIVASRAGEFTGRLQVAFAFLQSVGLETGSFGGGGIL